MQANGRLLTGLIVEATPKTVTLVDAKNERTTLARDDLEELKPSLQSLMPEKILDDLDEQQIRDLLSFVQADGPRGASPHSPTKPEVGSGKGKAPLKVCLVSGSLEYKSDESLAGFQKYRKEHYNI